MSIRNLMIEYIAFAYSEQELQDLFHITEQELQDLSDVDLLELYDQTLLAPIDL